MDGVRAVRASWAGARERGEGTDGVRAGGASWAGARETGGET